MKIKIFSIIQPGGNGSILSRCFDWMITSLILLSVVTVFVVTFDLPEKVRPMLAIVETVASIVFTFEYVLRIWTADLLYPELSTPRARFKYIMSGMAVIDLLAILPFWLPQFFPESMLGMRALRLVRLLRILKLNRYFDAVKTIGIVIAEKKRELVGSVFFVALLMLVASLLMHAAEHDAQPHVFKNAFSGLWWAVATLTTVGYGDIYPVTVPGRILGALIAFSGVAALAIPTGIITSGLMERVGRKEFSDEVSIRAGKDAEHDRLLEEQRRMLKELSVQVAKLASFVSPFDYERDGGKCGRSSGGI